MRNLELKYKHSTPRLLRLKYLNVAAPKGLESLQNALNKAKEDFDEI